MQIKENNQALRNADAISPGECIRDENGYILMRVDNGPYEANDPGLDKSVIFVDYINLKTGNIFQIHAIKVVTKVDATVNVEPFIS